MSILTTKPRRTCGPSVEEYLRIGVWHHPVVGPKRVVANLEFLEHLARNRVKFCMTGDVHEMQRGLIRHWHEDKIRVIGAGSFASPDEGLPASAPRLYNVLEIRRDYESIRVHTREQVRPEGAWDGWHQWPNESGPGRLPYFDIDL